MIMQWGHDSKDSKPLDASVNPNKGPIGGTCGLRNQALFSSINGNHPSLIRAKRQPHASGLGETSQAAVLRHKPLIIPGLSQQ
jgi:hypothetical protein